MLRERSALLQRLLLVSDLALVAAAWVGAWALRFLALPALGVPLPAFVALDYYLGYLPAVLLVWAVVLGLSGLYDERAADRLPSVVWGVARAVAISLVASAVAMFLYRAFTFSRLHLVLFGALTAVGLAGLRVAVYVAGRRARRHGRGVQRVLVVGAGKAGQRLARAFRHYPWMGVEVAGFLDDRAAVPAEPADPLYPEPPHPPRLLGRVDDAGAVLDRLAAEGRPADWVFCALPASAQAKTKAVADACAAHTAHLALVPDLFQLDLLLNSRVTDVDGLPVIHVLDEAPLDVRRYAKRALDVAFSLGVVVLLSPALAAIAAAVKLSSPGPVFYRQERMGLNGQTFEMLKFRSMPVDAEAGSGAVWARSGESRATRVGSLLRKTSLDELPQFLNVLRGDMSVVGPRPERPVFIEEFRHQIPGYMLRHKTKAGITGWAQVHGWRGNTSLERRIEHDLYYIQNWSLKMDLKIIWMTLFKGFVHENAY